MTLTNEQIAEAMVLCGRCTIEDISKGADTRTLMALAVFDDRRNRAAGEEIDRRIAAEHGT